MTDRWGAEKVDWKSVFRTVNAFDGRTRLLRQALLLFRGLGLIR